MSLFLLVGAAAVVAIIHSILPDHWVPLAVVARTQRWSLLRVGRVTFLASLGHVITSLVLGGIIAMIGLRFQQEIDTQQGHIVGAVLILTGILFLVWGLVSGGGHKHGGGHSHTHGLGQQHDHSHEEGHSHDHEEDHAQEREQSQSKEQPLLKRLAAIAVPFGVAASPDLTILPVVLAASAIGTAAVVSILSVFTVVTMATFISLTVVATLVGYQIKGNWLEKHATTITSLVLIAIGLVAFIGF
jgi:nickel/cobalt exporter